MKLNNRLTSHLSDKTERAIARCLAKIMEEAPVYVTETGLGDFSSSQAARDFFQLRLMGCEREHFEVVFLNNQHKLIDCQRMFSGTVNAAAVYPREIAKEVLKKNATAVILAHNHPSGMCQPSEADKVITKHIQEALKLLDCQVLDHVIVAKNNVFSFTEHQLIWN